MKNQKMNQKKKIVTNQTKNKKKKRVFGKIFLNLSNKNKMIFKAKLRKI